MRKIDVGTKAYVFTSFGLVKGVVTKKTLYKPLGVLQFKLNIDIDRNIKDKQYNFWYTEKQLNKYYFVAIMLELFKPFGWWIKKILSKF